MKNFWTYFVLCLKGIAMGAANVIPGVSGGTIAFITGIYERLVKALSSFDRQAVGLLFKGRFKELYRHVDGGFLAAVLLGIVIAALSLAKLMVVCLRDFPIQTWAFFFGLIIASAVIMLRDFNSKKFLDILWIVIGICIGIAVCTMGNGQGYDGLWYIFICGAASITAMILPGISGSFILCVMGKYEFIMNSIDGLMHLNLYSLLVLVVFALGCVVGILLFAKFLNWLLSKWNHQTMVLLTGFVLGSLVKVWPWNNYDATPGPDGLTPPLHIPGAILFCLAGIALILGFELAGHVIKKKQASVQSPDSAQGNGPAL